MNNERFKDILEDIDHDFLIELRSRLVLNETKYIVRCIDEILVRNPKNNYNFACDFPSWCG